MGDTYPDIEICGCCHDNAVFYQDEDGEWLSECCDCPAVDTDPFWTEDRP